VCWRRHRVYLASTHLLEGQAASLAGLADACLICNENNKIFWSNAVFQKKVELSPEEVNGRDLHAFMRLVTEFDEDGAPLVSRYGKEEEANSKASLNTLLNQLERSDGFNSEDTLIVTLCMGTSRTFAEARISSVNAHMGAKYYAV
jgi:PAS domain-containing protein